jgi:hypothetical protein
MPVVNRKAGVSGMVTRADVPLTESAPPNFPDVDRVALPIVPVFPFPVASVTVAPDVSLNP